MGKVKKVLASLLAMAMAIPGMATQVSANDLTASEYVNLDNGIEVKLIAQFNGTDGVAVMAASDAENTTEGSQNSVFDNNTDTKVVFRTRLNGWGGVLAVGDYVGVEFKEAISLNGIEFVFGNHGEDYFADGKLQVKTTTGDWADLKSYNGNVTSVDFNADVAIVNVTGVRLVNGTRKDNNWVHLYDIIVDGEIPAAPVADYLKVTQAINAANALNKDDYVSFKAVEDAIAAVDYTLGAEDQATIDAYAQAINDAIAGLVKIRHELNTKYIEIVEVGNEHNDNRGHEPLTNIFDGNPSTLWHTNWDGSERETHHFTLKVPQGYYDSVQLLHRPIVGPNSGDENGVITELKVYVKHGADAQWEEVCYATGIERNGWQTIEFDKGVLADYIKFVVVDAQSSNSDLYASLAELKIFYAAEVLNRDNWKIAAFFSNGNLGEYTDTGVAFEKAGNADAVEGPAEYMIDNSLDTKYHTDYSHVNDNYYKDPSSVIIKLGKQEKFNFVDWLNRTDTTSCRLALFEVYTIDDANTYTDEELKTTAPWVKKFATTAENAAYARLYIGEQNTQYVKIVCRAQEEVNHLTCADLNLLYVPEENMGQIVYSGMNATLNPNNWIKESAYDQYRTVKGYYGIVSGISNVFYNTEANLVRYIDSSVLSVKAQSAITAEDKVNVRFITSIASYNLEELRFKIEVLDADGNTIRQNAVDTHRVFKSIVADGVEINDASSVFGNNISTHFAMCKLNKIPRTEIEKGTQIKVTPYWAPKDVAQGDYENYVKGIERTFTVEELFNNASQTETISEVE